MEVDSHPHSEIQPPNGTSHNNSNNANNMNTANSKDNHSYVLDDILDVNHGSGQRIKLQVEVGDFKFLNICDPAITISLLHLFLCIIFFFL